MPEWIAILKTGSFRDSGGKEHNFTAARLDELVKKYDPSFHEAPEVIGHPKTNAPAFGWVRGLKREGDILFYEPKDRVAEFQEMLDKHMFKKRSVRISPKVGLVHVGWLGAQPPAVKGLPDVAFAEGDDSVTFEFSDRRMSVVGRMFRRLREFIIEKHDTETADRYINEWDIEELSAEPQEITNFSEKGGETQPQKEGGDDMSTVQELEEKLRQREKEIADLSEKDKAKDEELAKLKKDLAAERAKNQQAETAAFCDSDEMKEKITPAMKPAVLDFMDILSAAEDYEFAEVDDKGAEKKVKKSPAEAFKAFLKTLPKSVEFSEVAKKGKTARAGEGTAEDKLDRLTHEKMKATKDLSYSAAFAETQKENPELAQDYTAELRGGE